MNRPKMAALTLIALLVAACSGPSIPHPVTSTDEGSCLACHRSGTGGAPKTPHPDDEGCVGCHEPGQ